MKKSRKMSEKKINKEQLLDIEVNGAETDQNEPEAPVEPEPRQEDQETRLLRLQADFDNFRKRTQREKSTWAHQANEKMLTELLSVLDHFEMGLKTADKYQADSSVLDGFRLVQEQLIGIMRKFGLEPIEAEGQPFDPHWHESVTTMPSEEVPAENVVTQTRRGYKLGAKVLRPAQVVVSSGAAATPEDEEEGGSTAE